MSRSVWVTGIAAFATFCFVQDLVTKEGTSEYVRRYKQASPMRVDQVMRPAVDRSVRDGLAGAAGVAAVGAGITTWSRRRRS